MSQGAARRFEPVVVSVPTFVRMRTAPWGRGGCGMGPYLASLFDVPDLSEHRVLGVDGNTDMLVGLLEGAWTVASHVAVESDLVTAAFFHAQLDRSFMELHVGTYADGAIEHHSDPAFDLAVVRTDPARMTAGVLSATLERLKDDVVAGGQAVVTVAIAETTLGGRSAADRLAESGELDRVDDYLEYEWALGRLPLYTRCHLEELCAPHGWELAEVREPRRGFQQHHVRLERR